MSSGYESTTFHGGITFIGEKRQTMKGDTVVNISVAVSKDKFNEDTHQWDQDAGGKYYNSVVIYGRTADNVLATFKPGDHVIVEGERVPKPPYTDKRGVKHENESEIVAKAIGPNLDMWPWQTNKDAAPAAKGSHRSHGFVGKPAPAPHPATPVAVASAPANPSAGADPFADDDTNEPW